jgi:hypothetical protein
LDGLDFLKIVDINLNPSLSGEGRGMSNRIKVYLKAENGMMGKE